MTDVISPYVYAASKHAALFVVYLRASCQQMSAHCHKTIKMVALMDDSDTIDHVVAYICGRRRLSGWLTGGCPPHFCENFKTRVKFRTTLDAVECTRVNLNSASSLVMSCK